MPLVLVRPLQFINDVQLFCLSCRRDAFERLRQYKDALNDCNLLINVCPPGEVDCRTSARLVCFRIFFLETRI